MKTLMGWCSYEHHKGDIDEDTYGRKANRRGCGGCYGCRHFFPYSLVKKLSKIFKVTPQTIRRWVRTGKLESGGIHVLEDGEYFECHHQQKAIRSPVYFRVR